jgi:hypothetical protein
LSSSRSPVLLLKPALWSSPFVPIEPVSFKKEVFSEYGQLQAS